MVRPASVYLPPGLYQALKDEGFNLPPECGDILMDLPVDGIVRLHYVQNLTPEDLVKFGRALARIGGNQQQFNQ